ncbi:MAG TPA: R3H domain-containing nucleic acid-binding protein [Candidatus Binatia bacterium]|nr:R3H domain-containing nucleic acid-binding protein [Candidatus Binatia bacterium]
MENSNIDIAKKTITEVLAHMGFESEIFERQEEGRVVFNIRCSDAKLLIGKQGSTLESLQYLVKLLVYRQIPEDQKFSFALDVDDYKDKRVIYLKDLARKAAHQVRQTKKAVSLVPMPSHERRVVHNYLSLFSDVSSESIGEEPNRKLIIKYKKPADSGFSFIEEM